MKPILAISLISFLSLNYGCQKSENLSESNNLQKSISLYYSYDVPGSKYEAIITDSSGNFLLDTIVPHNSLVNLEFNSNDNKFNVSTIIKYNEVNFQVNTYFQVSPSLWYINQPFDIIPRINTLSSQQDIKVNYHFAENIKVPIDIVTNTNSIGVSSQLVTLNHKKANSPYFSYILFPESRLYDIHQTIGTDDSLYITKMDTATLINYSPAFETNYVTMELLGYRKKNDYSSYIYLWNTVSDATSKFANSLVFPDKGFEQYALSYYIIDKNQDQHYLHSLSDKVPQTAEFLDVTNFSLTKKGENNYGISFPKGNPSYFTYGQISKEIVWNTNFAGNTTSFEVNSNILDLKKTKYLSKVNFEFTKKGLALFSADNYKFEDLLNIQFNKDPRANATKIEKYRTYSTMRGL